MSGALGILFLHHDSDKITLHNLESIRRQNPGAVIATVGAGEALPNGYSLKNTPHLRKLHARLPQRSADVLVCSWFLQKREKCDKWWIVEWDVFSEMPVMEYYQSVWHYPFVASSVCLPYRDLHWHWFKKVQDMPAAYQPFAMGAVPFLYLLSDFSLEAICRMLLKQHVYAGNAELRFATAANRCGFAPCGFTPPNDRISSVTWRRLPGDRGIFHAVKHYVDYRNG